MSKAFSKLSFVLFVFLKTSFCRTVRLNKTAGRFLQLLKHCVLFKYERRCWVAVILNALGQKLLKFKASWYNTSGNILKRKMETFCHVGSCLFSCRLLLDTIFPPAIKCVCLPLLITDSETPGMMLWTSSLTDTSKITQQLERSLHTSHLVLVSTRMQHLVWGCAEVAHTNYLLQHLSILQQLRIDLFFFCFCLKVFLLWRCC